MPHVCFLLGDTRLARHDNHRRLPRAFADAGWSVTCLAQETVQLTPKGVRLGILDPARVDLLWLLGLGRADTFFDRMQLLHLLPQRRFVNPVDALMYWHAKYAWWPHMPETYASADPAVLKARLASGGDWVVKPGAGSYGREVLRIADDAAGRAAIDRLTGTEPGRRYCLLQRYVPEIERGETRTLVAGGRPIGSYLRLPGPDGLANLAAAGTPQPTTLGAAEQRLVNGVVAELNARGIGFAAVDTTYPHLIEVNLANPGGLATLETLYGEDPTPRVVEALTARLA